MQPQSDLLDMNSWFQTVGTQCQSLLNCQRGFGASNSGSCSELITREMQDISLLTYSTLWNVNVVFSSKKDTSLLKALQISVTKYKMSKLYSMDYLNPSHHNKEAFVIFFFMFPEQQLTFNLRW